MAITEVYKSDRVTIYAVDDEFYVYSGQKLIRVCPSIGMAREVAAGL